MDDYESYIEFKKWDKLFQYSEDDVWQFNKILAGVTLKDKEILEVGFGAGSLLSFLHDQKANVHGVEIQPRLVQEAHNKGYNVSTSLDHFTPQKFDLIIALDVLEHLDKTEMSTFLRSVSDLLHDDGLFIARFPNCQSPASLYNQFGDPTHRQMLSGPIVQAALEQLPLELTNIQIGHARSEYTKNIYKRIFKKIIKAVCDKIVRIALGYSTNLLAGNIVIYVERTK